MTDSPTTVPQFTGTIVFNSAETENQFQILKIPQEIPRDNNKHAAMMSNISIAPTIVSDFIFYPCNKKTGSPVSTVNDMIVIPPPRPFWLAVVVFIRLLRLEYAWLFALNWYQRRCFDVIAAPVPCMTLPFLAYQHNQSRLLSHLH